MTATAIPSQQPGPCTLAAARLGRALGINVRLSMQGKQMAIVLDDDAYVLCESAAMTALTLNKLASAVERRFTQRPAAVRPPPKPVPEAKAAQMPGSRRIG